MPTRGAVNAAVRAAERRAIAPIPGAVIGTFIAFGSPFFAALLGMFAVVGGIAAGVFSWFWERMGADRPILVVVEPERAACLLASARAGALAPATGDLDTVQKAFGALLADAVAKTVLRS